MKKIILASASPRRKDILSKLPIDFDIIKSDIDEDQFSHFPPEKLVRVLSYEKANHIFNKFKNNTDDICIIGCDTVVSINEKTLGKPKNKKDALNMLVMLNNASHNVFSGLSVLGIKNGKYFEETIYTKSVVHFSDFSKDELMRYVDTDEPMDKAGSYGIQDKGSFLISSIEGDFYSIMGLSINKIYFLLKKYGFLF